MARRRVGRAPGPIVGRKQKGQGRRDAAKSQRTPKAEEDARGKWSSEGEPQDSDAGQVNSEDDEDIDSDEAFDESDEERFSAFKFLGSSSTTKKQKRGAVERRASEESDGEDAEPEEVDDGDDEEDNGMYMDLSDMLGSGQTNGRAASGYQVRETGDEGDDDGESEDSEDSALEDSGDEENDGQLESLSAFVNSLTPKTKLTADTVKANETVDIPATSQGLSMNDIVASLTDPSLQSFRKALASQQTKSSKTTGTKLAAPVAKPIKDKLEREAAYEEAKTEISKWQPIVKSNREADHLQFPMNEPAKSSNHSAATLAGTFEPSHPLEKQIDALLRESGLRSEKEITSFEDLALKRVSIDEVRARQAQLRAMRELMFRQHQKSKRIAKIKSKTYRKIHKRERERNAERRGEEEEEEEGLEEKQMKREVARAKERMTLRHKNTGEWAKKMLSRGQHDLETRQAISEQIRRGDDLQRKILGEEDGEEGEDAESDSAESLGEKVRNPEKWGEEVVDVDSPEMRKGILGMKFMRDAEERQKKLNAEMLAEIRDEMNREEGNGQNLEAPSSGTVNSGRKTFVPGDEAEMSKDKQKCGGGGREPELQEEIFWKVIKNPFHLDTDRTEPPKPSPTSTSRIETTTGNATYSEPFSAALSFPSNEQPPTPEVNPWLSIPYKNPSKKLTSENRIERLQAKRKRDDSAADANVHIDVSLDSINEKLAALQADAEENANEDDPDMSYTRGKIAFQQAELISRAFASDALEADFEAEKETAIAEDAPREEDLTLPGWGSWTGQGVKRRVTEKKLVKRVPGIEASKRKDAKLKHVIINEKIPKKNTKYLAGVVPHPFETREQYERSLSMPVGPEWSTREMFQKMTKPRISVRVGAVVNPLQAPFN